MSLSLHSPLFLSSLPFAPPSNLAISPFLPHQATFETSRKKPKTQPTEGYKDPEFYMSHYQSGAEHDTKGYVLS